MFESNWKYVTTMIIIVDSNGNVTLKLKIGEGDLGCCKGWQNTP
jgi:hypothetical protein